MTVVVGSVGGVSGPIDRDDLFVFFTDCNIGAVYLFTDDDFVVFVSGLFQEDFCFSGRAVMIPAAKSAAGKV